MIDDKAPVSNETLPHVVLVRIRFAVALEKRVEVI